MIFEVTEDILDKITEELPYLRYNDTQFIYLEEQYLSKDGKLEKPWKDPEEVIIHRASAELPKNENVNFETDLEGYKDFCKNFFDESATKTLANLKHFLMTGVKGALDATEIANWNVIQTLQQKVNLKSYLEFGRWLIRIPCGEWNINLVKFAGIDKLYLEITTVWDKKSDAEKLHQTLSLKNPIDSTWAEIALNRLDAEES